MRAVYTSGSMWSSPLEAVVRPGAGDVIMFGWVGATAH